MTKFVLYRQEDVTGVSGTGVVAEGVIFSNQQTVIHWFGERQSVVIWPNVEDAVAVHGHDGRTTVVTEGSKMWSDIEDAIIEAGGGLL